MKVDPHLNSFILQFTRRACFAASYGALILASASVSAARIFVQLDDRWYSHGDTTPIVYTGRDGLRRLEVVGVNATACRRPGGATITTNTTLMVIFGFPKPALLSLAQPMVYRAEVDGTPVVRLRSLDGDLICTGEIPDPIDRTGRVFRNGFE